MVIYPDGIWYGGVTRADIGEIIDSTILNGRVIERLLVGDPRYAPERRQYPILVIPAKKG
jgi:(2Fe-2S) ferredoxin